MCGINNLVPIMSIPIFKERSPRITHKQLSHLVQFMEQHEDLSIGKLSLSLTSNKRKELWKNLEILLNSDSFGPQKSVEQWRKCWNDQKCYVRLKATEIERMGTSNAPPKTDQFTDLELRILNMIKNTNHTESPAVPEGDTQRKENAEDGGIASVDGTTCDGTDNLFQSTICSAAANEEFILENGVKNGRKRTYENPEYLSAAQIAAESFEEIATKKIAVLERLAVAVENQTNALKKQTFLLTEIVDILKSNKT